MSTSSSSVLPPAPAPECQSAPCPVTCAKNLILRAWRERWSDVQWAVRLKPVLRQAKPQGESQQVGKRRTATKRRAEGDSIDLSRLLLDCALVGPSPNALIMGYLKHSLAAGVVSYPSVLRAVASFDRWERPHCSSTLVALVDSFLARAREGGSGRAEDAVALAVSMLHLLSWLLRLAAHSFETLERCKVIADEDQIEVKNYKQALDLIKSLLDTDHSQAMLFVGREEEKDTWKKVATGCKLLSEQVKQCQVFVRDPNSLKVEVTRLISAIKNLDPGKAHGPKMEHGGPLTSYAIQPVIVCEALSRSTSDLSDLSFYLHYVAISHGATFSDVAFQIFRGSLSTLARKPSVHALKMDAFVLVRLPSLLDRLASLMRIETGAALKTPTETYKALDRLMRDEPLLDEADARFECSIIDVLLKVVGKCSPALITETEATDVSKRRRDRANSQKVTLEDMSSSTRNLETTLKAESTLDNLLVTMNQADCSKAESMENLLGVLCLMINGESLDRLMTAGSSSRLATMVRSVARFSAQAQESQGESVKNSLLRAAVFDVTFLMLARVAHCFGGDIVKAEALPGSLVEAWVTDMMLEEGKVKPMTIASQDGATADTLLQQLHNGELRTQVVRWQNACFSVHLALKEMISARAAGALDSSTYAKMVKTAGSKLCALPVCALTWLLSHRTLTMPPCAGAKAPAWSSDAAELVDEFMRVTKEGREEVADANDVPYAKERTQLMNVVMDEMLERAGMKRPALESESLSVAMQMSLDSNLTEALGHVWDHTCRLGRLDTDSGRIMSKLLSNGGPKWFVSSLVDKLLSVAHEDDLKRQTDLLCGLLAGVDLPRCAEVLLTDVLPSKFLLASSNSSSGNHYNGRASSSSAVPTVDGPARLADPHGSALARLTATCMLGVLVPHQLAAKAGVKTLQAGQKRSLEDATQPGSKMRRLLLGDGDNSASSNTIKTEPVDDPSSLTGSTTSTHPLSQSVSALFRLLHSVLLSAPATPRHSFAVRLLEHVVLLQRGRFPQPTSSSSSSSSSSLLSIQQQQQLVNRARLVLRHLDVGMVAHLVRTAPEMFTVGLVTQLFDLSSPEGRVNTARILCDLRRIRRTMKDPAQDNNKKKRNEIKG